MKKIQDKKPIKTYQEETNHKKTIFTKKYELEVINYNISDKVTQKIFNTTLQLINKINPTEKIVEVENFIEELSNIRSLDILKNRTRFLNSQLKDRLNPKDNIKINEVVEDTSMPKIRLQQILFDNRFQPSKVFIKLFTNLSYLFYTNDKNVIRRINNLSDELVIDYVKKNNKFFSNNNSFIHTAYPYGGGKKKFYNSINENIRNVSDNIKTVIDPFMGGFGSFYSMYLPIRENNLTTHLNDFNPAIYNIATNLQGKTTHKKMIENIARITQYMFVKLDTPYFTFKEYNPIHKKLLSILNRLERTEKRKNLQSSILLFLMNNGFGGNYKMKVSGSYVSTCNDNNKIDRYFNFVGKIEFNHWLFTSVKVKFHNEDYSVLIKKFSTKKDTFTTFDPPYFKTNNMEIEEFNLKMEEHKNSLIEAKTDNQRKTITKRMERLQEGSSYNYGLCGDGFNHEQLLKDISKVKGHFNYFNYVHPIIKKYAQKEGYNIDYLDRKSTNGKTEKGVKIEVVKEVFMTDNITIKPLINDVA